MEPREVLTSDFPDLRIDSLERLGEGWDHLAVLVNGDLVFRLPWHLIESRPGQAESPNALAEVALLNEVVGRLPVAVPEPAYVAEHGRYFGYRYLPGKSVEQLVDNCPWRPDQQELLTDLIVDVVTAIEAVVPTSAAAALGLRQAETPRYPDAEQYALRSGILTAGMESLFDSIDPAFSRLWTTAMERPVATLHADLGLDHWLVDDDLSIYALIDWSDSCVGPPELQLSTLMWHAPELASSAARRYAELTNRLIDGDLMLGCGYLNALSDVGGLLREPDPDEDEIDWCLVFLRRWSELTSPRRFGARDSRAES